VTNENKIKEAYSKYAESLRNYARHRLGPDDAEDVVQDAFMEVMALPDLPEGDIEGLLMQRLKWRISDAQRAEAEVLETDLGTMDDDGQERPMELSDLEEAQSHHGSIPPWPSAVDYDSPEEIVTAAQMRDKIREYALEDCGEQAYAVFCASVVDQIPQHRIAKTFRMDQATVSRVTGWVRDTVAARLRDEGFKV
jgi:RNA polymerase sigma factor (sigma-70 family)